MSTFAKKLAKDLVPLGGYLRCEVCGWETDLGNIEVSMTLGWPKCCNLTMHWWTQHQIDAGEVLPQGTQ
jgi:hypothetical protein